MFVPKERVWKIKAETRFILSSRAAMSVTVKSGILEAPRGIRVYVGVVVPKAATIITSRCTSAPHHPSCSAAARTACNNELLHDRFCLDRRAKTLIRAFRELRGSPDRPSDRNLAQLADSASVRNLVRYWTWSSLWRADDTVCLM